ncbi:ras family small GTPase, partial [Naegleria gruberi]
YDRLRPLSYPDSKLILLCFSLVDRISFNNLFYKWIFEIRFHLPNIPIILIGCKYDLREDIILSGNKKDFISTEEGEELAKQLGCITYWECCAKNGYGMNYGKEIIVNGCLILNSKKIKKQCLIQ